MKTVYITHRLLLLFSKGNRGYQNTNVVAALDVVLVFVLDDKVVESSLLVIK